MITRRFPSCTLGFASVDVLLLLFGDSRCNANAAFVSLFFLLAIRHNVRCGQCLAFEECVNALARLETPSVARRISNFPHILVGCATPSPSHCSLSPPAAAVRPTGVDKHSAEGRRTRAGGGYRPLTFVEMKPCVHTRRPSARPLPTTLPTSVGNKAPSVSL